MAPVIVGFPLMMTELHTYRLGLTSRGLLLCLHGHRGIPHVIVSPTALVGLYRLCHLLPKLALSGVKIVSMVAMLSKACRLASPVLSQLVAFQGHQEHTVMANE